MDNYYYLCQYCGKNYIPTRRVVQKYCSNSCRTRAYQMRNPKATLSVSNPKKVEPTKIEKMSIAGVGNAAVGTLAVNALTSIFTSEENKPATKKDLKNMIGAINGRYHPIRNLPMRNDGALPIYDFETQEVIYQIRTRW